MWHGRDQRQGGYAFLERSGEKRHPPPSVTADEDIRPTWHGRDQRQGGYAFSERSGEKRHPPPAERRMRISALRGMVEVRGRVGMLFWSAAEKNATRRPKPQNGGLDVRLMPGTVHE